MATIRRLREVIEILTTAGLADNTYFDMDHDIIFIPWHERDGETAEKLRAVGCHFAEEAGSWATY